MLNNKISFYLSAKDNKGSDITVQAAIDFIKSDHLLTQTNFYRNLENGLSKEQFKKTKFPAVTWSGFFSQRKADKLKFYSGLICIDIDKLTPQEHDTYKKLLRNDPYILFMFTSPSGNGLKLIFKISNDAKQHLLYFEAISAYLLRELNLVVDVSGKDVSRLCFLCSDADCHFNNNAATFADNISLDAARSLLEKKATPQAPAAAFTKNEANTFSKLESLFDVHEFTSKKIAYAEGTRNRFIYLFACNACRKGFDQNETHDFITNNYPDREKEEIKQTVQNAYNDNISDFGKYAKKHKNENAAEKVLPNTKTAGQTNKQTEFRRPAGNEVGNSTANESHSNTDAAGQSTATVETGTAHAGTQQKKVNSKIHQDEEIEFWYFNVSVKDGKEKKTFAIDYNALKNFLSSHGFYRLPLKDGNYQFIKITGNKVKPVTPLHIRDFIYDYVESKELNAVADALTRGGKQYLSTDKFERLPYREVEVKKHTEHSAYFYYQNGMVEVNADDILLHPYNTLNGNFIWESSVNKRDVEIIKGSNEEVLQRLHDECEVYKFIYKASYNDANKPADLEGKALDEFITERADRFYSICAAIGYLLHQHKTPSKAKAIIAIDHQIPQDRTEQNGGTGKSIIGNYILKNMLNVAYIPGKDYNEMNAWRWEPITIDSQVVFFNDVKYNFNFEGIFELITDDMLINRRNIGYLTIPFDQSPKIYISTNFIPKGDGTSFKRRTHVIEFDNYFNEQHTPYDEFGHNLFHDWRDENACQWNLYDNFIFRCVQMYLQQGLLPYPAGNYEQRKLIAECPQEFIDWMDATEEATGKSINIRMNHWLVKKELLKKWHEEAKSLGFTQNTTPHSFTKMVKKFCSTKKIMLHIKKTNGVEYYSFGKPDTDSPTTQQQDIFPDNKATGFVSK